VVIITGAPLRWPAPVRVLPCLKCFTKADTAPFGGLRQVCRCTRGFHIKIILKTWLETIIGNKFQSLSLDLKYFGICLKCVRIYPIILGHGAMAAQRTLNLDPKAINDSRFAILHKMH